MVHNCREATNLVKMRSKVYVCSIKKNRGELDFHQVLQKNYMHYTIDSTWNAKYTYVIHKIKIKNWQDDGCIIAMITMQKSISYKSNNKGKTKGTHNNYRSEQTSVKHLINTKIHNKSFVNLTKTNKMNKLEYYSW